MPSHRLLVRAGYIRRAAPGGYTWLPLGKLVLDRVADVVREEMAAIGGAGGARSRRCCRASPTRRAGGGPSTATTSSRSSDRRGADYLLAPTHEEMFTLLVSDLYASYRDYPVIALPGADEVPRRGAAPGRAAARARVPDEGRLLVRPRRRRAARRPTPASRRRTSGSSTGSGCATRSCTAMSGAMGGSASEEFLATTPVGEDTYVGCTACDYAANTEAVVTPAPAASDPAAHPAGDARTTPRTPRRSSRWSRWPTPRRLGGRDRLDRRRHAQERRASRSPRPARERAELLVIGVPGDREVDLKRLDAALHPATVAMFDDLAAPSRAGARLHRPAGAGQAGHPLPGRPAGRGRAPPG